MRKITPEMEQDIIHELKKKTSISKISEMFNISRQSIYNYIIKNNLPFTRTTKYRLVVNETYKGLPYKTYCKDHRINVARVHNLVKYDKMTIAEAIEKLESQRSKYTINGIPAWNIAKKNGVPIRTFWARINQGKPLEEVVLPPRQKSPNGYNVKTLMSMIANDKKRGYDIIKLILQENNNNIKYNCITKNDARSFFESLKINFNKEMFKDFWDYFLKNSSYDLSYVWRVYIKQDVKQKLWKVGDYQK